MASVSWDTFERYKQYQLTNQQADHAALNLYREGVLNLQRLPEQLQEYEKPRTEGYGARNAWRLFNAATFVLTGRVAENPRLTHKLHKVVDGVRETVH